MRSIGAGAEPLGAAAGGGSEAAERMRSKASSAEEVAAPHFIL